MQKQFRQKDRQREKGAQKVAIYLHRPEKSQTLIEQQKKTKQKKQQQNNISKEKPNAYKK